MSEQSHVCPCKKSVGYIRQLQYPVAQGFMSLGSFRCKAYPLIGAMKSKVALAQASASETAA